MSKVIALDFGHGGSDSGAVGNGLKEKDVTLWVGMEVTKRLEKHGFKVITLRTNDSYVGDASERGSKLGNTLADYALSIHVNSGGGTGGEIFVPCRERYGYVERVMADELGKLNKFRGIKSRELSDSKNHPTYVRQLDSKGMFTKSYSVTDYYGVIREAWKKGVSATIVELFFIDNVNDVVTYNTQKSLYVEALVKAICEGFGVPYQPEVVETPKQPESMPNTEEGEVWFRAVVGSYKDKANADKMVQELKAKGYSSAFVTTFIKK
jgi:N-acetylmuramoyl-L-alanine amidase